MRGAALALGAKLGAALTPSFASSSSERDQAAITATRDLGVELQAEVAAVRERRRPDRRCRASAARARRHARAARSASETTAPARIAVGASESSNQPICGGSRGTTSPPSAIDSAWPPKHSPSTGTSAATASRSRSSSAATHGGSRRWPTRSDPSEATKAARAERRHRRPGDVVDLVAAMPRSLEPLAEQARGPVVAVAEDQAPALSVHREGARSLTDRLDVAVEVE